jgi:hypothetical protein
VRASGVKSPTAPETVAEDEDMNTQRRWLIAIVVAALVGAPLALAPVSGAVAATMEAEVEALQMPAWLTRGDKRVPLALGAQLRSGDTITTGKDSRAVLRLADGSTVKLGENARFELNEMSQKLDGGQQVFSANFGVVHGAFRFTTSPEDKSRTTRKIDVKFDTVTASIAGTDLWGKSTDDREIVALIEGKITATRRGDAPVTMDQAKTVYIAPRDAPPAPVVAITLAQLNGFAQETELQPGAGAAGRGGSWKVYAARTPRQEEAVAVYERLRDAGYAAAIQPAIAQGKQIYQVRIVGLLSEADGVAVAIKLRVELGLQDVHVSL